MAETDRKIAKAAPAPVARRRRTYEHRLTEPPEQVMARLTAAAGIRVAAADDPSPAPGTATLVREGNRFDLAFPREERNLDPAKLGAGITGVVEPAADGAILRLEVRSFHLLPQERLRFTVGWTIGGLALAWMFYDAPLLMAVGLPAAGLIGLGQWLFRRRRRARQIGELLSLVQAAIRPALAPAAMDDRYRVEP